MDIHITIPLNLAHDPEGALECDKTLFRLASKGTASAQALEDEGYIREEDLTVGERIVLWTLVGSIVRSEPSAIPWSVKIVPDEAESALWAEALRGSPENQQPY